MKSYAKAMLMAYKKIEPKAAMIDREVMSIALSSMNISGERNTMQDMEGVTYLTEYKIQLINLSVLIREMLDGLEYKYRQLAKFRYMEGDYISIVGQKLGLSERTMYRLLDRLPSECAKVLTAKGCTDAFMIEQFGDIKWFMNLVKMSMLEMSATTELLGKNMTKIRKLACGHIPVKEVQLQSYGNMRTADKMSVVMG